MSARRAQEGSAREHVPAAAGALALVSAGQPGRVSSLKPLFIIS